MRIKKPRKKDVILQVTSKKSQQQAHSERHKINLVQKDTEIFVCLKGSKYVDFSFEAKRQFINNWNFSDLGLFSPLCNIQYHIPNTLIKLILRPRVRASSE